MSDLVDAALEAARRIASEGATLALEGYRAGLTIEKKGAIDLLTEYDLRVESLIRARLAEVFPSHAIVGEETDATGSGDLVWYVDPIDGTTNYAHGHPFFAVSIALYDRAEGLVGVVAAPALGVMWHAARGRGAFRNGEPCQVSTQTALDDALCATGFPYDRREADDDNLREYTAFMKRTQGIRRCGAASVDLALVADGTYDVYWEQRLSAWDLCAGALLIREAGGRLSDYDGGTVDPRAGTLVATNGPLHDAVIRVLAEVRAELGPPGRR